MTIKFERFTSGTAATWTKETWAQLVRVVLIGGGGSGGGAACVRRPRPQVVAQVGAELPALIAFTRLINSRRRRHIPLLEQRRAVLVQRLIQLMGVMVR